MPTEYFITELFSRVDDKMLHITKHAQAALYPSEVVTLALLFALKGRGNRAFYRWLRNNWLHLFPNLGIFAYCSKKVHSIVFQSSRQK